MKIRILYNPECSKCNHALDMLQCGNEPVEVVEYLVQVPTVDELRELVKLLGLKPEELVRKSEPLFQEKFAANTFSDEEYLQLLHTHPILIQRPIIIKEEMAILGRTPEAVSKLMNG